MFTFQFIWVAVLRFKYLKIPLRNAIRMQILLEALSAKRKVTSNFAIAQESSQIPPYQIWFRQSIIWLLLLVSRRMQRFWMLLVYTPIIKRHFPWWKQCSTSASLRSVCHNTFLKRDSSLWLKFDWYQVDLVAVEKRQQQTWLSPVLIFHFISSN